MNDAEMYQISNQQQKRDAVFFLKEYTPKFNWKEGNISVMDIGCGDGGVTSILRKYIPRHCQLLGCDISENMVKHAGIKYSDERTSFTVMDIAGELTDGLKGNFDHVFSFYALHWIINQERAFTNIYELLKQGGECFAIFVADAPVFDVYRILERNDKWSSWVKQLDIYTSPYREIKDPAAALRNMLDKIGFTDVNVECKELEFIYENMKIGRKALKSICPFEIPEDLCNDFMDDYTEACRNVGMQYKINDGSTETLGMKYRLLVVHARK